MACHTNMLGRSRSWCRALVVACIAVLLMLAVNQRGASADDQVAFRLVGCTSHTASVTLSPTDPTQQRVAGELCARSADLRAGHTVQLLIPGATYNHAYWDFPVNNRLYSYARTLAAAGFPTFAFDRVGTGASSHPPSSAITVATGAFVAHQLVQGLRSGALTGTRFGKVIEVGHSLGSQTAWAEAIAFHDVDALIITGQTHFESALFQQLPKLNHPANQDPNPFLQSLHLDDGYLTTVPGARPLLYNAANADPVVIATDEATKDAVAALELFSGAALITTTATRAIDVPVLVMVGAKDPVSCDSTGTDPAHSCATSDSLFKMERPFYGPQTCLAALSVPNDGHAISLHRNARLVDFAAIVWSTLVVGRHQDDDGHRQCLDGAFAVGFADD